MELDGDACWRFLRNNLRDEIVFIIAFALRVTFSSSRSKLLFFLIFTLFLVDKRQLMISWFRVISVWWWILRRWVEGCFACVINYKWRLIVIGSLFCYYIRSTTARIYLNSFISSMKYLLYLLICYYRPYTERDTVRARQHRRVAGGRVSTLVAVASRHH